MHLREPAAARIPRTLTAGVPDYPRLVRIHLELTYRCGRDCLYCIQRGLARALFGDLAGARRQEMTTSEIGSLVDQAGQLGVEWLNISGGEPLLRRDLPELIRRAASWEIKTVVPTKKCPTAIELKRLADAGLTVIGIGLDADLPEIADRLVQQDGYFDASVESIRAAKALGLQVMLLPVITRLNISRFPRYLEFAAELGVDIVRPQIFDARPMLRRSYEQGRDPDQDERLSLQHPAMALQLLRRQDSPLLERDEPAPAAHQPYPTHCAIGKGTMSVRPDGKVYFCPLVADLVVGDVRRQSLVDIWYDGAMREVLLPSRERYRDTLCGDCVHFEACTDVGRCAARCLNRHGRVFAPDPAICQLS